MSRVGKKPILIPQGVTIKIDGQKIMVSGPKGELERKVRPEIKVELKDNQIILSLQSESKQAAAFWGLFRSLIFNMVEGVVNGFEKKLEMHGLGYRASKEGEDLVLQVGFSHPVKIDVPDGISFAVEKNIVIVSGIDKEKVTQMAAKIRKVRPPEPYKGKGIRYQGEKVRRKTGKRVATGPGA